MPRPGHKPRDVYREGARYRVVKEGARLEGLIYFGETSWSGYSRNLPVGAVVMCTGWKPGYGTISEGAQFTDGKVPDGARWMTVWPQSGLFDPYPMSGYLQEMGELEG